MSKQCGTVLVISMVWMPDSMAVRHAWKPVSASSVRSTPHRRLGKASAMVRKPGRLSLALDPHPRAPGAGGIANSKASILVHTYDRGRNRHREHPRPDHPRGG